MEHDDSYANGVLTECTIQVCGWIYCICMTSKSRLLLEKSAKSLNSIEFPYVGWLTLFEIHHFDFGSPCLGSGSFRRIFPISLGLRWEKSKSRYHDVGACWGLQVCHRKQTISIHQLMVGWFDDGFFASLKNCGIFWTLQLLRRFFSARKSYFIPWWMFHPFFAQKRFPKLRFNEVEPFHLNGAFLTPAHQTLEHYQLRS